MISITVGYILDLLLGDPQHSFHPIRLIGNSVLKLEQSLRIKCKNKDDEYRAGIILWILIVAVSFFIPFFILMIVSKISIVLAIILESILCYYVLATKCLGDEAKKIYESLNKEDINQTRKKLSYIVGRDTENLDEKSIVKATIETVAENTSDGVIAPLFYLIIGGAPLGFAYKAINTLDSMIGYKNEKYLFLGRFSAKADDVANFLPARFASFIMMISAKLLQFDFNNALKIYKRDKYNHLSPNSAHTEAVCAGALRIELGGGNYYKGKFVSKPTIGDDLTTITPEHIIKSIRLMYMTSIVSFVIMMMIRFCIVYLF